MISLVEIKEILEERKLTRKNEAIWMPSYAMNVRN
jgi:hypothetical protein